MSSNGRLAATELEVVEDNDQLAHGAAAAFRRARSAWYAEGGRGACIVEPAGAYRSWQVQYDMKHGIPSLAYWNLNPNSKAGLAAAGTSTHGTGTRFDATPGFNTFLLRRGRDFGWSREFGAADPNHWKHDGIVRAGDIGTPIPAPSAPPVRPPAMKGRSMTQLIYTNILEPLTPAQVAFVRACPGGADLKLTVGLALVALVGDGLGRAAVQVTEVPKGGSNPRADGWVADHTGWIDGGTPRQGGRPYEPAEFWDLLAAYASAPASGGAGGGTFVLDDATIAKLAQANAAAFFAEQKKPGN